MKKSKFKYAKMIYYLFAFIVLLLAFNIVYLTVTGKTLVSQAHIRDFAKARGGSQTTKIIQARRGTIYTSDKKVIATDVKKYNLVAILSTKHLTAKKEPAYVQDKEKTARVLAKYLGTSYDYIYNKLKKTSYQVEFGNVGKNVSALTKKQIDAQNLTGLEWTEVTSRNYEFGDFASYEVGYAGLKDANDPYTIVGQMGIEKTYNSWLSGKNGKTVYLADANKNQLPGDPLLTTKAIDGNDVYMTINSSLQTQLDSAMKEFSENVKSSASACAIMDAKTGRILAISNYPSFDPNKRNFTSYEDKFMNMAIEPGSVFKSFVYANALSDGKLNLKETYVSGHFNFMSANKLVATIHDHNKVGWGTITYEQGLYHSSNTAICHILLEKSDMQSLIQDYSDLGFFKASKIDGLVSGSGVRGFDGKSKSLSYVTTGFGQGSSVTALQLLRAYSVFANKGRTVEPYIVDKVVNPDTNKTLYKGKTTTSKQIFTDSAIDQMRSLLSGIVNSGEGTGTPYKSDEVEIIGKTGTGQIAVKGGYSADFHTHLFAGLAPYDDPRVEIIIWWQNDASGTDEAGQIVKDMMKSSLNVVAGNKKTIQSTTYKLKSYINQSTNFVSQELGKHSVTPIIIGDGTSVIGQYPASGNEVASSTHVMLRTDGTNITMPSMLNWSRKDAEAFGELSNTKIEIEGVGTIYQQDVNKGTKLTPGMTIKLHAK